MAKAENWSHVKLVDAGAEGLSAMASARGAHSLIIVDGDVGGKIGEAPRRDPAPQPDGANKSLSQTRFHSGSCRWEQALHALQTMFGVDFPKDVLVVLVEGAQAGPGSALSANGGSAVEKAIERIVDRVEAARRQGRDKSGAVRARQAKACDAWP
jgi:hydrogenase maturation protease